MRAQSQAASPWPEVPLSPKTPPAPSLAPEWHVLDVRASRSASIPEDERSEDGGGGERRRLRGAGKLWLQGSPDVGGPCEHSLLD